MTQSDMTLPELTRRQEDILSLIVRSYTENAEPVGSKFLVDTYELNISSATVRAEMARLEDMGYLVAPHTSSGRIPTALGYRYVVRQLLDSNALTTNEKHYIETKFSELPAVFDQWMRQTATILSRAAHTASLVTPPLAETSYYKHMELVAIQGRLVLMVLVLQGGAVHQRMLNLADTVPQNALSQTADRLNKLLGGMTANQIRMKSHQLGELEREVAEIATDLIDLSSSNQVRVVYRDGLSEIINTFPDNEGARQVVRVFEERAFLEIILTEILQPIINEDDVQVVIAGDGREEMDRLSLVLSYYGIPGKLRGTLGVVGPTNINYGRAISAVRHVSGLMTNRIEALYDADDSSSSTEDINDS